MSAYPKFTFDDFRAMFDRIVVDDTPLSRLQRASTWTLSPEFFNRIREDVVTSRSTDPAPKFSPLLSVRLVVDPYMPENTIFAVPGRRGGETDDEWLKRCVVVRFEPEPK